MGAKYSIGQVMSLPHHSHPLPIAEVVVCYRFVKEIGALWREEELSPYVKPLGVGDRVRHTRYRDRDGNAWDGVIIDMMATLVVVRHSDSFSVFRLGDLERIPTEANQ